MLQLKWILVALAKVKIKIISLTLNKTIKAFNKINHDAIYAPKSFFKEVYIIFE